MSRETHCDDDRSDGCDRDVGGGGNNDGGAVPEGGPPEGAAAGSGGGGGGDDDAAAGGGDGHGGEAAATAAGDDGGGGDSEAATPPGPDAAAPAGADDPAAALEAERLGRLDAEEKLKRALADMQNLTRRTEAEIDKRANETVDRLLLDFIGIRDDLARARDALSGGGGGGSKADADGLDSILRNVDSLLGGRGVRAIDALGEIFDPGLHEAVSVVADAGLDDGTITREIRKGYISRENVLRPTLVEISRKEGEA